MSNAGLIADRYAKALFDLAVEQGQLDAVAADGKALTEALAHSPDLHTLIYSPIPTRAEQTAFVAKLAEKAEFSAITRNLLGVLAKNRRLNVLPDVLAAFAARLATSRGEKTAEVTSAHPLHMGQVEALKAKLQKQLGGKVTLDLKINPEILGGLIVKIGSRMIDSSVRGKLDRLELVMKGNA